MTGRLIAIDGRWARMGMAMGIALLGVALLGTLRSSSFFDTSISSAPSALTSSSENLPAGLEAAISATLGDAYLIAPGRGEALEARNPRQNLEARFSAAGIGVRPTEGQWSFDLSLTRYGRQGQLFSAPTSQPLALGARVEYEREAFTEWYENRPRGIEQGFTLASPPSGEGLVEVELRRSETLWAALAPDARSVLLSDPQGTLVLRYQDLVAYDASGQELSARLELGPGTISLLVDDRGAAYPITIDPLLVTEQAHLLASDGAANDFFGISVALAGDTALVSAYQDDTAAGADAGSAYVFVRSGTTWTEQAHLFASDGARRDYFGGSVALAGDTALVGAAGDNTAAGGNAGSAYVFVLSPAPPGEEVLNHFSCYTLVKTPAVDVIVDLSDQFGTHHRRVRHADFLCNPATKEIEGQLTPPVNLDAHLKCYRIVPPEEPKPTRLVEVRNQLTPDGQVIQVNSTREVCAPATKDRPDLDPGQLGLDHFTCYSAVGPSVKKRALLSDQFLSSHSVLVSKAQLLCNPTEKRRADRPGEVVRPQFPNRHLVCYRVEPNPNVNRTVHTEDQFRVEDTTALVLKYLCVPSEKRVV